MACVWEMSKDCVSCYFWDRRGVLMELRVRVNNIEKDGGLSADVEFYKQGFLVRVPPEISFKDDKHEIVLLTEPLSYSFLITTEFEIRYFGQPLIIGKHGIKSVGELEFFHYEKRFF